MICLCQCVCVVGWFSETGREFHDFCDIFSESLSRKSGSSAGGGVSSSYEVNSLPRAESTTTSGNSSSARASRRRSSRPSVGGGSQGNTSEGESFRNSRQSSVSQTQPRGRQSTSKKGAPSSTQTLSRGSGSRSQETETDPPSETVPGPSVSGSTMPAGSSSVSRSRLGSATPRAKKRAPSSSSQDVTELSLKRRLELSPQPSPRRLSSRSTPSAYRLSVPSARQQPVMEAVEVETDGEPALLGANSSDEEETEETSRSVTPKISINQSFNQDQSVIS